jgi:molybdate transport system substrate-binding protein
MKTLYPRLVLILIVSFVSAAILAGCSSQQAATSSPLASTTAERSTTAKSTTPALSSSAATVSLTVAAAASLTDVLKEIDAAYTEAKTNVKVTPNFASSGTLQTQIENGAPIDIFISAGGTQMDNLQKENLILVDTRKNLLNNRVVLVVPIDSILGITSFEDLALDKVKKIAVGDPKSVPAGTYAAQAFDELGIAARIAPKEVLGADARAVLTYVETANVDAGVVYSTDALTSSKVKVVAVAPADINARVVYPVAVIAASKNRQAAREFIDFLYGPQAKASFEKFGFTLATQ